MVLRLVPWLSSSFYHFVIIISKKKCYSCITWGNDSSLWCWKFYASLCRIPWDISNNSVIIETNRTKVKKWEDCISRKCKVTIRMTGCFPTFRRNCKPDEHQSWDYPQSMKLFLGCQPYKTKQCKKLTMANRRARLQKRIAQMKRGDKRQNDFLIFL